MTAAALHTTRLTLSAWTPAATELMGRLARTPGVVRYIGDGRPWSDAHVAAVAERNTAHWAEHGFGWRLATLSQTGDPVGFIALNFAGEGAGVDAHEYEIGWWLTPAFWGRRLAQEGATAVRDEGFDRVGAPSILARIHPGNAASLAVARGIGLAVEGETAGRGGERILVLRMWQPGGRTANEPRRARLPRAGAPRRLDQFDEADELDARAPGGDPER